MIEILNDGTSLKIKTENGDCFDIVLKKDGLDIFAANNFGAGLIVVPCANNMITIKNTK